MLRYGFNYRSNRGRVLGAMKVKYRTALMRIGAYTHRVAKRSIRDRKKPGDPGSPPTNRTGAIKNFMRWSLDRGDTSVVIGPTLLPRPRNRFVPVSVDVPFRSPTRLSILTFGGTERRRFGGDNARYESRPFMQLALKKAIESKALKTAFKEIGF